MIYRHIDATFPKYMVREFGSDVMYGTILAINPLLVIILVPIISPFSLYMGPYTQIIIGTTISAISPISMVLGTSIKTAIMFVIILSIGEAIWAPRLYDYALSFVKRGQEGMFMALSNAPLFFTTLLSGILSGFLLENFEPADGSVRKGNELWLIVLIMSLLTPICLIIFRKNIEISEEEILRNEEGKSFSEESPLTEDR